jgi:beta-ribofuranosylaminobenzene 5'-phosphate synthase
MSKLQLRAGARLHFGLLDLSGATRRVDGGVGLSISDPAAVVTVQPNQSLEVEAPREFISTCHDVIKAVASSIELPNLKLTLQTETVIHCGFGSGTQIALSIATALLYFANRTDVSISEMAVMVHRGGTSGIGVHAFYKGGLIVDAGRAWPKKKDVMGPSSIFTFSDIPPCVAHIPFPDWGICIVLPSGLQRVHGKEELQIFKELTPIPLAEVECASRLILTGVLPAAVDTDFDEFCRSVEELRYVGMKRRQWELLSTVASSWEKTLKSRGFRGISTSSWGPAIFGFAPSLAEALDMAKPLRTNKDLRLLCVTKANNKGHIIDVQ